MGRGKKKKSGNACSEKIEKNKKKNDVRKEMDCFRWGGHF